MVARPVSGSLLDMSLERLLDDCLQLPPFVLSDFPNCGENFTINLRGEFFAGSCHEGT